MKPMNDQFPVLKGDRRRLINAQKVDEARRVLWRAFQHGALSEDEFASALDRLEFATTVLDPYWIRLRGLSEEQKRCVYHTLTVGA